MILDVGDAAVLHGQDLRPPMRIAVAVGPREHDRDAVADLLDRVDLQPAVTAFDTPAERGLEDLTGLVRPVSGGDGSPEPPARPSPAPLHLGPHERDERLDVSLAKGGICGPNLVDAHDRHATNGGSRPQAAARRKKLVGTLLTAQRPAGVGPSRYLGRYALRVVPRAPNFCALRRVSSNLDRA